MLGTAGQLLEIILKFRLERCVEKTGGISNRQNGFSRGHSTAQNAYLIGNADRRSGSYSCMARRECPEKIQPSYEKSDFVDEVALANSSNREDRDRVSDQAEIPDPSLDKGTNGRHLY